MTIESFRYLRVFREMLTDWHCLGWLQDPVHTFPKAFGPESALGGRHGVAWMRAFPYALPNIVSAAFLLSSILLVVLGLEEVGVPPVIRCYVTYRLGSRRAESGVAR